MSRKARDLKFGWGAPDFDSKSEFSGGEGYSLAESKAAGFGWVAGSGGGSTEGVTSLDDVSASPSSSSMTTGCALIV